MAIKNFSWVIENTLAGSAIPGKSSFRKDSILADMVDLKQRGIDCLVSLTDHAISFSGLCHQAQLKWMYYPITDFGVPENVDTFQELINDSLSSMDHKISLCVHCYAGIGRTGIVLACIVGKYYSMSAQEAIELVRRKRTAIETDVQIDFITNFLNS